MRAPSNFKWTNKAVIQFGIIIFCFLFGTAIWIIHTIKNAAQDNVEQQLNSIMQAAHETTHYWLNLNIEAATNMANRPNIKKLILQLIQDRPEAESLKNNTTLKQLRKELQGFIQQYGYKGFFVVPHNQLNYGSMRDNNLGQTNLLLHKDPNSLLQAFAGETVISKPVKTDVPLANQQGILQAESHSMFVLSPVTDAQENIIALLMFRIAPAENFEKILQVGRVGKTGETYVINNAGLLLSPSRFDTSLMQAGLITPDTASTYQLVLREPTGNITKGYRPDAQHHDQPLTQVVQNILQHRQHNNIEPIKDYRGVKVVSMGHWDTNAGIGFISQIDYQEAFTIYLTTRNAILVTTGLLALLMNSLIIVLLYSRHNAIQLVKKRTQQLRRQNASLLDEIDERKKIEQILQQHQQTTTAILQSAFDAIIATDKKGCIELVNPATETMFGYAEHELLGQNIKILMPDAISKRHDQMVSRHSQGENSPIIGFRRELEARRKDGSLFPIELALEETCINGEIHFTSTINDITERKEMIERLSYSEKQYRSIIEQLNDTFYRTDNEGTIIMASPSAEQLLGYPLDELIGLNIDTLQIEKNAREKFLTALKQHDGEIIDYEAQLLRKDGMVIWTSTNAHFYTDDTGRTIGIEGTTRDITTKKINDEEIHASRQRLSFHIKQTPLGVIEWDTDFKVVEWNPAAEKIFAYTRNEVIGRHAADIIIPAEYKEHIDNIWHSLLGKQGGQLSVNQNVNKQGETIWCEWHNTPLVDENMNVVGVASMIMDVTSRKLAEDVLARDHRQLQSLVEERTAELNTARLEAEQANEFKSEFLANMSHELRTPIHTILSFAEIGMNKIDKLNKEKLKQYFTNIHQGGERQLNLLNDLLDLSKLEAGTAFYDFTEHNIRQLIDEQIAQHELMLKSKQLRIKIQSALPETQLSFDQIRIEQVIRNLLSNAIKFSEPKTTITIRLEQGDIHTRDDTVPALTVTVSDKGVGIPEAELESIFDKFVQSSKTRTGAGGTGLGLAICKEIITAHGGEIWARNNEKGGGASFCFTLPILDATPVQQESKTGRS